MIRSPISAGGYFLTRPIDRPGWTGPDLLPAVLHSVSGCLADQAFEFWWNENDASEATLFGAPLTRLADVAAWYGQHFDVDLGAPNVAFSPAVISAFVDEFIEDTGGLVILGCGLAEADRERILVDHPADPGLGEYGVYLMLERGVPMEPGGEVLGFEVLSYEYGLEHSWLCNHLEEEARSVLRITPSLDTGLLDSYEEAAAVARYINEGDVGAEPGLWLPWQITRYPV